MRRYTVAALAGELDRLLSRSFPRVSVEGEVSQISTPASGHAYLSLRDADATLACVVWRDNWRRIKSPPKVGDRVVCHGRIGIYPDQSRYQLYANRVEAAGEGRLERQLAAIKARLAEDGLLDPRRKRPLPAVPEVIGLVTSPTGAALQDFLRVSRERWPAARIRLAGCKVQGPDAAASVVRALEVLYTDGQSDVIVVTRGGGSKMDLLPFADEQLARWIATGPVPVVSAVGHEIDTTIADLVADAVAPTPSAAAMLVLPDGRVRAQRVDEASGALERGVRRAVARRRQKLDELLARLKHPARQLAAHRQRHRELASRLDAAFGRRLARAGQRVEALEARLRALSPLEVLGRGYAIVHRGSTVVRSTADVVEGQEIEVQVADGRFGAEVRGTPS